MYGLLVKAFLFVTSLLAFSMKIDIRFKVFLKNKKIMISCSAPVTVLLIIFFEFIITGLLKIYKLVWKSMNLDREICIIVYRAIIECVAPLYNEFCYSSLTRWRFRPTT